MGPAGSWYTYGNAPPVPGVRTLAMIMQFQERTCTSSPRRSSALGLMGALTLAGVPWQKWARWVLPLQVGLFVLGLVVLAVATAVGYGA